MERAVETIGVGRRGTIKRYLRGAAILASLATLVAASVTTGGVLAKTSKKVAKPPLATVSLGIVSYNASSWPLLVAESKFFAQERIKLTITLVATGASGEIAALQSNSLDLANAAADGVITADNDGANIIGVAGWSRVALYSLLAAPGITSASQLQGKVCGATNTSTGDAYLMRAILARDGLTYPNDYSIVISGSVAARVVSILTDQISCGIFLQPQTNEVIAGGGLNLGTAVKALGGSNYAYQLWAATPQWAQSHSDVLTRLLTALVEADQWLHNSQNQVAAARILAASPAGLTLAQAKAAWQGIYGSASVTNVQLSESDVKAAIKANVAEGLSSTPLSDWSKFANLSYIKAATKAATKAAK